MNKKNIIIGGLTVIVFFAGFFVGKLVGNNQPVNNQPVLGSGTRFINGLSTDSTSPSAGEVRTTTLTVTGASALSSTLSVAGLLTLNAGQLQSYTNASSSVTTGTLKLSDLNGYDTFLATPTGAAANKTLTFFASSTASTWLPTAGDKQETCFVNSTTTAETTLTFAAGTGIDLETSSSTPTDLTIEAGGHACFIFMRQSATASTFDISALMTEYQNAD